MNVATMVRTEQRTIRNSERAPLQAPNLRGTVGGMPATPPAEAAIPAWVESDLLIVNGRDPLGLDAIATYRIMPELLPGILQLSRRARYFSFFAYLLSVFRSHVDQPDMRALDLFIRRAEYEYGYAVLTCERCSDDASWRTGVLGEVRLRPARRDRPAALRRGLSVDTTLGGYGLFYRNPLQALNVVAAEDTPLDNTHNAPHDVLANSRARELAAHFAVAVAGTDWARRYLGGDDPVPAEALAELADAACLCRLDDAKDEREALISLLTSSLAEAPSAQHLDSSRRLQGLAHFLEVIGRAPPAAASIYAWRQAMWEASSSLGAGDRSTRARTSAAWGAFAAREVQSAAVGIIFDAACRLGKSRRPPGGWRYRTFLAAAGDALSAGTTCTGVEAAAGDRTRAFAGRTAQLNSSLSLEWLLSQAKKSRSVPDSVSLLLELCRRLPDVSRMPPEWRQVASIDGEHQDGLLHFADHLSAHLETDPRLDQTVSWLVRRYVLGPHERVAMSKLPRHTFRFRYDAGELVFYQSPPTDLGDRILRHEPLSLITRDLGLWRDDGTGAIVTARGRLLIREAFTT